MTARGVLAGYLLGVLTIVGCASANLFPWPYYATHMPETCYDQGTLYGKAGTDGWPDQALAECKPDPQPSAVPSGSPAPSPVLLKCITVKIDDFYALKAEHIKCQTDLEACQHGPQPGH